jgi:hypothetical protein
MVTELKFNGTDECGGGYIWSELKFGSSSFMSEFVTSVSNTWDLHGGSGGLRWRTRMQGARNKQVANLASRECTGYRVWWKYPVLVGDSRPRARRLALVEEQRGAETKPGRHTKDRRLVRGARR